MKTRQENVVAVYDEERLVAIIKRDNKTRGNVIYTTEEANIERIAALIDNESTHV